MAQRRSKNRRLSARRSNVSGFLNDDTNVYDNDDDPLWFDRTAIRPSTSLCLSKHTTAVLDPDSTVHASQLSDNWFENLTQSESSRLMGQSVRRRTNKENEEPADSDRASAATESESEHEVHKRRANLRAIRKPSHKIDKSNAFMKALEKTTDSHTRNLTHAQMVEGNESESTHDDSKTIMKVRPKFVRRAKNDTHNFDKALESDSASERASTSRRSLRSSKRISEANEGFATPEKQLKLRRSVAEKIAEVSVEKMQNRSVDKTKEKSMAESSVRELRNRSVNLPAESPPESVGKSSSTKRRSPVNQSADVSSSSPEVKKQRHQLFSQGNRSGVDKSKGDKSAFEAALDSVNHGEENVATLTEEVSTSKRNEQNETQVADDDDDSDSSSIPQNIRRTRSRSFFGERKSGETGDVNASKRKSRNSSKVASQSSKNDSVANQSNASDKRETSRTNLTIAESSDEEEIFSVSFNRSKPAEQEKSNKSEAAKSQKSSVESSDSEDMVDESPSKSKRSERDKSEKTESSDSEDMVDESPSKSKRLERDKSEKTESGRLQVSSIESSDDEDMVNVSPSKAEERTVNVSNKSKRSSGKANESKTSNLTRRSSIADKDEDAPTSPALSNRKSRSRLLQKKNASKDENAFDKISFNESSTAKDKSKEQDIEETPRSSQRSPKITNKSQKNQSADVSKSKSASRDNSKADVTDDETSTIAPNIRRTRSRLFQKSKAGDDDNAFEFALEAENAPANRSVLSQKSRISNKSANKSHSAIRDATAQRSIVDMLKKKPQIVLDKVIRPADSAGLLADNSSEENQENKHPNAREPLVNKEKSVSNSQPLSGHRSVETSSDGTPNPQSPREASTPFPAPAVTVALPNKRTSTKPSPAKSAQNSTFDDLLHTPNPAQSTLIPRGKPVNRITQFSFTTLGERTPLAPKTVAPSALPADKNNDDDVDVTGDSDVSDCPLLSRQLNEIPHDKERTTFDEDEAAAVPVVSKSPKKKSQAVLKQKNTNIETNEIESTIDWEKAKKHTDAVKMMADAQLRLAEEARKKRELEKHRIDVKFKRLQAQREAELKRKNKKPVHKAFLVDGKVYKQPKLPRPKPWATDKLYKYLQKRMEPKYGVRTRVKSEEFVVQLSDFATRIAKRKKFENYSAELDELMLNMARLGIIETRYDFHRFAADFMPYSFREKVNPIAQPGNRRNIPYDPRLVNRPLLEGARRARESDSDES